ncbi:hypothetical protein CEXT_250381 [Caerostris extrusa]|uniref:Transmembrane protein n=1 Tax=Caerostris extrusa TaxID=172846 RepID=A0AAV4QNU3_CAEEX|nr:hypothetical protein CEXT_250381 [Caerostris extrusa]
MFTMDDECRGQVNGILKDLTKQNGNIHFIFITIFATSVSSLLLHANKFLMILSKNRILFNSDKNQNTYSSLLTSDNVCKQSPVVKFTASLRLQQTPENHR